MSFTDAKYRLSGSFGVLQIDGLDWGEVTGVTLRVEAETKDVRRGLDVDKKIVGRSGKGSMTLVRAFSRSAAMLESLKSGKLPVCRLVAAISDPDAFNGQEERIAIDNIRIHDIDLLSFRHGDIVETEYEFTFSPGDVTYLDRIEP